MAKNIIALAAVGLLLIGAWVVLNPKDVPVQGAPGTEHYNAENFYQPVTLGGNVLATSSIGAVTYTQANLLNTTLIQHTAASALTATLPASSTLGSIVPRAGDTRTFFLNPITTGITLAGGTGTDFNTASSTKFCIVNTICKLEFVRKVNSDIEVLFSNTSL